MDYIQTSLDIHVFAPSPLFSSPPTLTPAAPIYSNLFKCLRCGLTLTLTNEFDCVCPHCRYRMFQKLPPIYPVGAGGRMVRAR